MIILNHYSLIFLFHRHLFPIYPHLIISWSRISSSWRWTPRIKYPRLYWCPPSGSFLRPCAGRSFRWRKRLQATRQVRSCCLHSCPSCQMPLEVSIDCAIHLCGEWRGQTRWTGSYRPHSGQSFCKVAVHRLPLATRRRISSYLWWTRPRSTFHSYQHQAAQKHAGIAHVLTWLIAEMRWMHRQSDATWYHYWIKLDCSWSGSPPRAGSCGTAADPWFLLSNCVEVLALPMVEHLHRMLTSMTRIPLPHPKSIAKRDFWSDTFLSQFFP